MTRKLWSVALALGLLAAACGSGAPGARNLPVPQFVPQVVDFLDDSGRSPSISVDGDGNPNLAYLSLPQELKPGEIAPARPLTLPMIPGILTASLVDGVWNHGAIVATEDSAKPIPLKPTDEVAIAIDSKGTEHAVFTLNGVLQYATAEAGGEFGEPQKIASGDDFFGLSIAADSSGTPWVAYYVGSKSLDVATLEGKTWSVETVGPGAGEAAARARTATAVDSGGPLVAFTDGRRPMLARRSGGGWSTEVIEPGGGGWKISLALDKGGNPHVAYYTRELEVRLAQSKGGGSWNVDIVAPAISGATQNLAGLSASIGLDDKGTQYVAWYDAKSDQTKLATDSDGKFEGVPVDGTEAGTLPVLAVEPDGSQVFVAWYDRINLDLHMGTYYATGAPKGITLAQESSGAPAPTGAPPTAPSAQCAPSGTNLTIEAPPGAAGSGFDTDCLAAPADKAVTVEFDNKDSGVPHNFEVFTDSSATERLGGASDPGDIIVGPDTATYKVEPLKPGNYFFRCDVHPTTMTGTYAVK